MQKSTMLKKAAADARRNWYVIDATDLVLGRLSVVIADTLRGKNKPDFTPNVDGGDHVIVVNVNKMILTGNKAQNENWYNHSHYIGGLRTRSGKEMLSKYADELLRRSVKGMLPKNRLSRQIINKLHIYKTATHPHEAQTPVVLDLKKGNGK
ncbi:50S ribosomal protein L13 [Ureaplasma sp. ES3154-GEN]|uniref:50S ribosomal protein L13 n=1 Tax=Ureaplasma sp. ES3154-GEN TaxID=2984844 RepID=UPI0021E8DD7E|nr:50S ribosomal protein L13 [Ureaplasma sp. ES3154-GEN]MCV3743420.1 50S ribosomal protein L13 [Ureaplasma sp. ES3154-GEN]